MMTRAASIIVGFGELTYDHIFVERGTDFEYIGSRGGGSVFNVLANIAGSGGVTRAVGVGGQDVFGQLAKRELGDLGVDVVDVQLVAGKTTRIIFERVRKTGLLPKHEFSASCPVCSTNSLDQRLARLHSSEIEKLDRASDIAALCVDRLTRERVQAATGLRDRRVLTVLDLGRLGFLRYQPVSRIASDLSAFDVVSMPEDVAESLVRRAHLTHVSELLRVGPRSCLFVTRGESGLHAYGSARAGLAEEKVEPPNDVAVLDEAGAGDAFLAGLLRRVVDLNGSAFLAGESRAVRVWADLARRAVADIPPVLRGYGARSHLSMPQSAVNEHTEVFKGLDLESIREKCRPDLACPFCGGPKGRRSKRPSPVYFGARQNVGWLLRRVFLAAFRKDAVDLCREILSSGKGPAYVVGTGGSYPVAVFLATLLSNRGKMFAQAIRPFDYLRIGARVEQLFVVSYSGATKDCKAVIQAASEGGCPKIYLLTGAAKPKLASDLPNGRGEVISYAAPRGTNGRERGFVSIAATVAPCALWVAASSNPVQMFELDRHLHALRERWRERGTAKVAEAIKASGRLAVFGGGFAWPAVLDVESKFTEAAVARPEVHEVKDFSHGRFVTLMTERAPKTPVLMLGVGPWHPYERALIEELARDREVFELRSKNTGVEGALELMVMVQVFAQECAEALEKDLSRPSRIPPAGLRLYRWKSP